MKSFYLFTCLLLICFPSSAQIFSPITTGDIVNDGGSAFGHSICDFNNDGWEDIFVSNLDVNQENLFYKNNGDGTFSKMPNLSIVMGNAIVVMEGEPTNVNISLSPKGAIDLKVTPNPVSISTTLSFELSEKAHVQLEILDVKGRLMQSLCNKYLFTGRYQFEWNRQATIQKLEAGYYIASLTVGDISVSERALIQD